MGMKHIFFFLLMMVLVAGPHAEAVRGNKGGGWGLGQTCRRPTNVRTICGDYGAWDEASCTCVSRAGSPSSGSSRSGGNSPGSAVQQAVAQCQTDSLKAQSDCDQDQNEQMQGAQTTLSNFAVGMTSQMGIQAACTGIGKALAGANAAVVAFTQMCISAKGRCNSSCGNAASVVDSSGMQAAYEDQVDGYLRACRGLDVKIQQANQAMVNIVNTFGGAKTCANQTSTDLYSYCGANPTAIGCESVATDCSNPSVAASNPICICKNNPNAASCGGAALKSAGSGFGDGEYSVSSLSGGAGGAGAGSGLDAAGLLDDVSWKGDPNLKADTSRAEEVGGAKGGRPLNDSGSGGALSAENGGGNGAGGANPASAAAVNAGFRGGGGGGGSWSSGGGSGGGWNGDGMPMPGAASTGGGPDLRQFLPGGKFDPKTRGLAGLSGPDGITGPHSDIWKKIQNRYQAEQRKLLP